MTMIFPRPRDNEPHAWGLEGDAPAHVWERFSPAYEALAERLVRALEARGYRVSMEGAGSEDGEFILVQAPDRDGPDSYALMCHLEDPNEANALAPLDAAGIEAWIDEVISGQLGTGDGQA